MSHDSVPSGDVNAVSAEVEERLSRADHYWLSVVTPAGGAHAVPVWGIWRDGCLYIEGPPSRLWFRALRVHPRVIIHLPDPLDPIIVEGRAKVLDESDLTPDAWTLLDSQYQAKYRIEQGSPYIAIEAVRLIGWDGADPKTTWRMTLRDAD
ncbi:MAG TPA: pyridoxamine 5'-phosphate oxidase family protein [Candidatus Dormibacteraeota bacterium]|nr:pyridoxamine 5'-phosphate oxidase family protein [Candidatus Dormibacteraeota bacterium]